MTLTPRVVPDELLSQVAPNVPRHVAVIMDGNGRWAQARGRLRTDGHTKGADAVRETVRACRREGVRYLTLYAFSVANWKRPPFEVQALMQLLTEFAQTEKYELKERGIRLAVIGDLDELPTLARCALRDAMEFTQGGTDMVLSLALSYGARHDVATAMKALAVRVLSGELLPEELDEQRLRKEMSTSELPDVDLLIRTGGESRVSDFLLLESAYAELVFLPIMWPDFSEAELLGAFAAYSSRERRFGRTSSQVQREKSRVSALAAAAR